MTPRKLPGSDDEWQRLAGNLLKAHIKMAGLRYIDLKAKLAELGVDQNVSNISAKLNSGAFGAVFFLQVLAATGVERLDLPYGKD